MGKKTPYHYQYFECGIQTGRSLYTDYRWIPELTIPMAMVIIDYLLIKRGKSVLDIGCAKGYLVKALRWLGRDAYGYDISEYALNHADTEISSYLYREFPNQYFHYIISKDTLEHIPLKYLRHLLTNADSNVFFSIVPLGNGKKFNIPAYELDITHIHKQPLIWWTDLFKSCGWKIKSAVPKIEGIKDNWDYSNDGNGFIVAER